MYCIIIMIYCYPFYHFFCISQVLSSSVADFMELMGDKEMEETIKFVRTFDRFFDCLNVRNVSEGRKTLKPDLYPYRTSDDTRFKVRMCLFGVFVEIYDRLYCCISVA